MQLNINYLSLNQNVTYSFVLWKTFSTGKQLFMKLLTSAQQIKLCLGHSEELQYHILEWNLGGNQVDFKVFEQLNTSFFL